MSKLAKGWEPSRLAVAPAPAKSDYVLYQTLFLGAHPGGHVPQSE